jgi:hypothetical protein
MSMNQEVKVVVNGKTISGQIIFRCESDISVRITRPYNGLTGGLHIPYFARDNSSFMGKHGDETALDLLKELEILGTYIKENRKFLKLQFAFHFNAGDYSDWEIQNRFFDSSFPFLVTVCTRDEVIKIMRSPGEQGWLND